MERRESVEMRSGDLAVEHAATIDGGPSSRQHPRRGDGRALATAAVQEIVDPGAGYADAEIEPIEQRTTEPPEVSQASAVVAFTRARWATAARARVGGRDEQEPGRQRGAGPRPSDADDTFLERLTQSVEHRR